MASSVTPTQPGATTAAHDKEDRFSRLTRPTRSSSQKVVDSNSRPPPTRPAGLTKPISAVAAVAGRRPRATSIALTKPSVQNAKPITRSPPRYGNAIPRPAANKNAALTPSSARTPLSPLKSVTSVKKDEPPLPDAEQDRNQDEVVTENIVAPAIPPPSEIREVEEPTIADVQTASAPGETQIVDAVTHDTVESPVSESAGSLDTTEELSSDGIQGLQSDSFDVSASDSVGSDPKDVAVVNTPQKEEVVNVDPVNEVVTASTIVTSTEPDVSSSNVVEGPLSDGGDTIHQDSMAVVVIAADDNAAIFVPQYQEKSNDKVDGLDVSTEDTIARGLDESDSFSKQLDRSDLSMPEETVLTNDDTNDNDVSMQTEGDISETNDSDTEDLTSKINEKEEVGGKPNGMTPLADRFVYPA